ncbi:ATP-dependent RNA helicase [Candidatus Woesebacteria bacterium]|nr:ATP-dependent RNA helicase [Candidatus Woesebacteria bacterium]
MFDRENIDPNVGHPEFGQELYRWRDGRSRELLPIDSYLNSIVKLHNDNQVVIVQAETGVGKTTRIGQALLDSGAANNIIQTQTRRPAVKWNAERIAEEMGSPIGQKVGWRLSRETPRVSHNTQLVNLIDQSLVNQIIRDKKLPEGTIIIDEAHERTISIDSLLLLIRSLLPSSPNTKLLITSATIDGQKFSRYFSDAPLIDIKADKRFPVETRVRRLAKYEHHSQAAISEAKKCVDEFVRQSFIMVTPELEPENPFVAKEGTVIVFLPGKEDITKGKRELDEYIAQIGAQGTVEVLSCHSEVSDSERERVKAPTKKGVLRIVCATEIVRSSVTPPTTIGVIDSLQVKRRQVDARGVTHLRKITIPGALADQGKGRGGRQNPSFYIPISAGYEYEQITNRNYDSYWPLPQITEDSVVNVALQFAAFGISLRDADLMDKPSPEKINQAMIRLQKIGALDDEEKITELGEKLRRFPIDPERAMVLITAEKLGVLPEALVATAVIENEGISFKPGGSFDNLTVSEITAKRILRQFIKVIKDRSYTYRYEVREKAAAINLESLSVSESLAALSALVPMPWLIEEGNGLYELKMSEKSFKDLNFDFTPIVKAEMQAFATESNSDFVVAVAAYRAYKQHESELERQWNTLQRALEEKLASWCVRNARGLSLRDVELLSEAKDIREAIQSGLLGDWVGKLIPSKDLIHTFRSYKRDQKNRLGIVRNKYEFVNGKLRNWAESHFLSYKKLTMVDATLAELLEEVGNSGLKLNHNHETVRQFDGAALTQSLASGLIDHVAILKDQKQQSYTGALAESMLLPYTSVCPSSSKLLLTAGVRKETERIRFETHFMNMAAPITTDMLAQAAPALWKRSLDEKSLKFNEESGRVIVSQVSEFNGQTIEVIDVPASGELGVRGMAQALIKKQTKLPFEAANLDLIQRARNLMVRKNNRILTLEQLQQNLKDWYEKNLNGAITFEAAKDLPLFLSHSELSAWLHIDYPSFEREAAAEYPDSISIQGVDYPMKYYEYESGSDRLRYADLSLPAAVIQQLQWSDFPAIPSFDVHVAAVESKYFASPAKRSEPQSLQQLKDKLTDYSVREEWEKYLKQDEYAKKYLLKPWYNTDAWYLVDQASSSTLKKVLVGDSDSLPALPSLPIWNNERQLSLVPVYEYDSEQFSGESAYWRILVLPSESFAQPKREATEQKKAERAREFAVKQEIRQLREDIAEKIAVCRELWAKIDPRQYAAYGLTYNEVQTDTYSYGSSESIPNILQKVAADYSYSYNGADMLRDYIKTVDRLQEKLQRALATFEKYDRDTTPPEIKQKRMELALVEKIHKQYQEYTPLLVISRTFNERWLISGERTDEGKFVPHMIPLHLPESGYSWYKGEHSRTLNEPSPTLQVLQRRFKQLFSNSLLIELPAAAGVEQSNVNIEEFNRQKLIDNQPMHQGIFTGYEYADGSGILVYMKSSPTDEGWELQTIDPSTWLVSSAKTFNGSREFRFIGSEDDIAAKMNNMNHPSFKNRTDGGLRPSLYKQKVPIADGLQGVSQDSHEFRTRTVSREKPLRVEQFISMQSDEPRVLLELIVEEKNRALGWRHAVAAVLSLDYVSGLRMSTKHLRQLLQLSLPFGWDSEINNLKKTLDVDMKEFLRNDSFKRDDEMETIYTRLLWLVENLDILKRSLQNKDVREYFIDDDSIELFLSIELELLEKNGRGAFENSAELAAAAIEEYTNR